MNLPKLTIQQDGYGTFIELNDHRLRRVHSVTFEQSIDTMPVAVIELLASPNIDVLAMPYLTMTNQTLAEAAMIMRYAIANDIAVRDGFIASIESAIIESETDDNFLGITSADLAEKILKRIVGEE